MYFECMLGCVHQFDDRTLTSHFMHKEIYQGAFITVFEHILQVYAGGDTLNACQGVFISQMNAPNFQLYAKEDILISQGAYLSTSYTGGDTLKLNACQGCIHKSVEL